MEIINIKHQQIHELKAYLTSTDYKVTKAFEAGYVIDEATLQGRENTRQQIRALEVEIAEMEKQISNLQEGEEYIPEVLTSETIVEEDKVIVNYFKDGVLVKTEVNYKSNPVTSRIEKVEKANSEVIQTLDDEVALKLTDAYPEWKAGIKVVEGEKYKQGDRLYKVIQPHTTQANWTPDITPALWKVVQPEGVIADFVQPTGAHDAYMIGEKVMFNGSIYESIIDNNVYSPTAYPKGWKKL